MSESLVGHLPDPLECDADEYLDIADGGKRAVYIHLSDDKEWWMAHDPDRDPEGDLEGPWLLWTTYPTGAWDFTHLPRWGLVHNVEMLYYVDGDGNTAHSIHEVKALDIDDAPVFVRAEVNND